MTLFELGYVEAFPTILSSFSILSLSLSSCFNVNDVSLHLEFLIINLAMLILC